MNKDDFVHVGGVVFERKDFKYCVDAGASGFGKDEGCCIILKNGRAFYPKTVTASDVHRAVFPTQPGVPDRCDAMTGHKHAKIMMEYAIEADTNPEPWREFEISAPNAEWHQASAPLSFYESHNYRRKPRTIRIGEFDVPEPMRTAPEADTPYWKAQTSGNPTNFRWNGDTSDEEWLAVGLIHDNPEAAALHGKALRSFTEVKGDE